MTEKLELDVSPITNDTNTSVLESNSKDYLKSKSKDDDYDVDDDNSCESDDDVASNVSDPIAEILYAQSSQKEQEINNEEFGDLESSQKRSRHDSTNEFDARLQPLLKILTNYLESETEEFAERSAELRSELEEEREEEEEEEQNLSIQKRYNEQENAISDLFADLPSMLEQENNDNTNTTIITNGDVNATDKTHSCLCAEISLLARVHVIKCLQRQILNAQCKLCIAQLRKIITELSLMHNILPDPLLRNLQKELANYVEGCACTEPNIEHNTSNEKLDTNLLHILSLIREYVAILQRELINATKNFTQRASVITLHFS